MVALALALALASPITARYAASAVFAANEVYLMGGSEIRSHRQVVQVDVLDPEKGKWRVAPPLPAPRDFAAIAASGRHVALAGGLDERQRPLASFDLYDLVDRTWRPGPRLSTAVSRAAAVEWETFVAVTGGLEGDERRVVNSRRVQLYTRSTSSWEFGPAMPQGRHGHSATVIGNLLIVAGGEVGDPFGPSASVIGLRPRAKGWVTLAPMPEPRAFHAAIAHRGFLYVFGNRGPAEHPLKYNPKSNRWTKPTCPDIGSHRTAFCAANGEAYFFGGDGEDVRDRVFDLDREAWVR